MEFADVSLVPGYLNAQLRWSPNKSGLIGQSGVCWCLGSWRIHNFSLGVAAISHHRVTQAAFVRLKRALLKFTICELFRVRGRWGGVQTLEE